MRKGNIKYKQNMVSIMGDSISTYSGYNPRGYRVYYTFWPRTVNHMKSVHDTWWWIVLKQINATLCVNGSFSGSLVSGGDFPAAESKERIEVLRKKSVMPDIIMVYMGLNDVACAVDIQRFAESYSCMLEGLKKMYPEARILCGTLMKTYVKNKQDWRFPDINHGLSFDSYNDAIRKVCNNEGVYIVDNVRTGIFYETLDTVHPTAKGHAEIASAWNMCLMNSELGHIFQRK